MATVYLARDLKHDRPVALKVLHAGLAHALGSERFHREIRFAARLQHPHILSVHDSGDADGLLWFTMPYVEGESLRDRLRSSGPFPMGRPCGWSGKWREALGYAHRRGIIHRDIKPENVMLATRPRAGRGLRHRAVDRAGRGRRNRGGAHRDRHDHRHGQLHEPGAGHRAAGHRRPERHLQPRMRAARAAGGTAAVHRPERDGRDHPPFHDPASWRSEPCGPMSPARSRSWCSGRLPRSARNGFRPRRTSPRRWRVGPRWRQPRQSPPRPLWSPPRPRRPAVRRRRSRRPSRFSTSSTSARTRDSRGWRAAWLKRCSWISRRFPDSA